MMGMLYGAFVPLLTWGMKLKFYRWALPLMPQRWKWPVLFMPELAILSVPINLAAIVAGHKTLTYLF